MSSLLKFKARKSTKGIILHDSHTVPYISKVLEVPRWEQQARQVGREMGLLEIGYHAIIERDNTIVETRHHSLIGSHTPTQNMDSIGVCLVGGREEMMGSQGYNNFTADMMKAFFSYYYRMEEIYGELWLKGHSEVQKYRNRQLPDCPCMEMEDVRQDYALWKHNKRITDNEDTTRLHCVEAGSKPTQGL